VKSSASRWSGIGNESVHRTDILIGHLRGNRKALDFLQGLRNDKAYELWTGAMQRAEVIFFVRPEEEDSTLLFLSQFKTALVDQAIIDKAAEFYRQWHPSHGIDNNDAILALFSNSPFTSS
jgi:predicted nucleic acid-binding protein